MKVRILFALVALALCAADASAGPVRDRLRARFAGPAGASCASCQPAPAAKPVADVLTASYVRPAPAAAPASSCPGGVCPAPAAPARRGLPR
jgi:hypothetical protein